MVEIIIERWSNRDGSVNFLWSIWSEGKRLDMGGPLDDPGEAEGKAREVCAKRLEVVPDRITRL